VTAAEDQQVHASELARKLQNVWVELQERGMRESADVVAYASGYIQGQASRIRRLLEEPEREKSSP
jgi:hypothetical protein